MNNTMLLLKIVCCHSGVYEWSIQTWFWDTIRGDFEIGEMWQLLSAGTSVKNNLAIKKYC